tara:strand:+ start:762 stop:944 length:183 start_codon:yes stop_codon:yes gene_type:complete
MSEPDNTTVLTGVKQINIAVSAELHTAFKTVCSQNGVDMKEVLIHCINQYIDRNHKERQA